MYPYFTVTINPIQFMDPMVIYNLDDMMLCITIKGEVQLETFNREEPFTIFN